MIDMNVLFILTLLGVLGWGAGLYVSLDDFGHPNTSSIKRRLYPFIRITGMILGVIGGISFILIRGGFGRL
jgi:uncharacterized membrane protein